MELSEYESVNAELLVRMSAELKQILGAEQDVLEQDAR
jgi:hypothetical protein